MLTSYKFGTCGHVFVVLLEIVAVEDESRMSLLNLGVRQLPLRHGGHNGVVGYPYCGINPNGWD